MSSSYIYKIQPGVQLIGIHGAARTGKDTVAEILQNELNSSAYILAFAEPLKLACEEAFGIDMHSQDKEEVHAYWGKSPREILQYVGTEMFREQLTNLLPGISENFWVARMHYAITQGAMHAGFSCIAYEAGDVVIIPDVRFQNEVDFILNNNGSIIHLTRPGADGKVGIPGHASESGVTFPLDPERIYPISNNSTLEDLNEKVKQLAEHFNTKF